MADVARRLILDENSLVLRGCSEPGRVLEEFSQFLHHCMETGERLWRWSGIYDVCVLPEIAFLDLLYGSTGIVDKEVRDHLQRAIDRCKDWDDESCTEHVEATVYVDGSPVKAPSLAFIHAERMQRRNAAAVTMRQTVVESDKIEIRVGEVSLSLHRVFDGPSLLAFYRDLFILAELEDGYVFIDHCRVAFPDLHFVPELAQQLRRFKTAFRELRPDLVHHLTVLNDRYKQIHAECQGIPGLISKRLGAEKVEMSGESSKTRGNKKAIGQRMVTVEDESGARHSLAFEPHTKLRWNCDRVHFHPGQLGLFGGRVIIGIFVGHLDT